MTTSTPPPHGYGLGVCEPGECVGEALVPVPLQISASGAVSIAAPGG